MMNDQVMIDLLVLGSDGIKTQMDRHGLPDGIIGPRARILEIPDVVAQAAKPEQVLEIIPRDASEGVLTEKSGDDDAHGSKVIEPC